MRGAWGIAAAVCAIAACSSSHPKGPLAPLSVPCGFRALTTDRWAIAVPLYWEGSPKRKRLAARDVVQLLTVDGGVGFVILVSKRWSGDAKTWTHDVLGRLKNDHYELVEQRPLPSAGEGAVLVETRRWDSEKKTQWHDWEVLAVAGREGLLLTVASTRTT